MNYLNTYNKIINKAINSNRKKSKFEYFERHHIIPKCLEGSNDKINLVLLTAKEHFICHHLLTKIYPTSNKLKFSFWAMCNQLNGDIERNYKINSTTYHKAKIKFSESNSKIHKNKIISDEQKLKSSIRMKNNTIHKPGKDSHLFNIPRTNDVKYKISCSLLKNFELSSEFKGYYITPFGKFPSMNRASASIGISASVIKTRCLTPHIIITKRYVTKSKDPENLILGKSFKELGWGFLSVHF